MSENHPTRREILLGMAAVPFVQGSLGAQGDTSSICFMSAVEMARLIRAKKLSAREALAVHLKQIERMNPKVNLGGHPKTGQVWPPQNRPYETTSGTRFSTPSVGTKATKVSIHG